MRRQSKKKLLAEINIVPYIDVMLVLLLVFMITTPLLYQGLEVDLPTTEANEIDISEFEEPLIVEINSKGLIRVIQKDNFNETVSEKDLANTIISIYKNKKIDKVYVKGDKKIEYDCNTCADSGWAFKDVKPPYPPCPDCKEKKE